MPECDRTPTESDGLLDDPRLPTIPGGWLRQVADIGWTRVTLALPADPDVLLADRAVLEANRRDDYMPYWASLWPAASRMAAALDRAPWTAGTSVLELGCGLGLVGIAGLMKGWDVLLTDYEAQSVAAAGLNAEWNGFPGVAAEVLDWRRPPAAQFPVILACDVLYEVRNHDPLIRLVTRMLTSDGCAWLGDPGRTPVIDFYHRAVEAGFHVTVRNEAGRSQAFPVRGQFQILELKRPAAREMPAE